MTLEIWIVTFILIAAMVLFATEKMRTDLIGLLVMVLLGLTGILKPKELFYGFSNEAVVTIGAMFVLSAALTRTGTVAALGGKLATYSKGSPMLRSSNRVGAFLYFGPSVLSPAKPCFGIKLNEFFSGDAMNFSERNMLPFVYKSLLYATTQVLCNLRITNKTRVKVCLIEPKL